MNEKERTYWDIPRFERWLSAGIESFVLDDAGIAAFPEAAADILNGGSLSQGMAIFIEGLDTEHKANFKQALANALTALELCNECVPVATTILEIAIATRAYPVLKVLSGKIEQDFFEQLDPTARSELFSMTLYAVNRLSNQGWEDAEQCMYSLIESEYFQPAHAGIALLTLCQIKPGELDCHLAVPGLRQRLQEQFAKFDTNGSLRLRLAQQVFERVQLNSLEAVLSRLQFGSLDSPGVGEID